MSIDVVGFVDLDAAVAAAVGIVVDLWVSAHVFVFRQKSLCFVNRQQQQQLPWIAMFVNAVGNAAVSAVSSAGLVAAVVFAAAAVDSAE